MKVQRCDALRAALVELDVPVIANHVVDSLFGSIDWAGVATDLGRAPTYSEITRAWLAMGWSDGWAAKPGDPSTATSDGKARRWFGRRKRSDD